MSEKFILEITKPFNLLIWCKSRNGDATHNSKHVNNLRCGNIPIAVTHQIELKLKAEKKKINFG